MTISNRSMSELVKPLFLRSKKLTFDVSYSSGLHTTWLKANHIYYIIGYNSSSYPIYFQNKSLYMPSTIDFYVYKLDGCRING